MSGAQEHRDWRAAFDEELRELRTRPAGEPGGDDRVGLAFSGGGIRSATFGLGVLEALKQRGLLKSVHYLSTVSGGGYIGAWLSASCRRHPDWLDPAADWDDSVAHLRRYSNYLSPKVGFFSADTWSMFTVWIRNTLLVQMTVDPRRRQRADAAATAARSVSALADGRRPALVGDRVVPARRRRHRRQPDRRQQPDERCRSCRRRAGRSDCSAPRSAWRWPGRTAPTSSSIRSTAAR